MKCACGKNIPGVKSLLPAQNVELEFSASNETWRQVQQIFEDEAKEHERSVAAAIKSARLKASIAGMTVSTLGAGLDAKLGRVVQVTATAALPEVQEFAKSQQLRRTAAGSVMTEDRDLGKSMVSGLCSRITESAALQHPDSLVGFVLGLSRRLWGPKRQRRS
jgi:hypothetical protein